LTQHSGDLVEDTALQMARSVRVTSNVYPWPFGVFLFLFFYSTWCH